MFRRTIFLIFLSLISEVSRAELVINEVMQSNIDCIMDDVNEFPDSWVELYNAGSTSISSSEYRLGLTRNPDEAYQLPRLQLSSHGYQLVYCDSYDGQKNWHAPFRLDSGKGGCIYLFRGSQIIDSIANMAKQPAPNIAYGRRTDGSSDWGYQLTPTPNASNCGQICERDHILGDPIFSEPGRVCESSQNITLALSLPEGAPSGARIRYTLNGTEPTASSTPYSSPITINLTRTIRAKVFCDGWLSPRSVAQSYLFLGREQTLPVVSIVTDPKYLTDNKIGICVDGTYQSGKSNYKFDWRRPINIEIFETPGTESVLNQLCETRIQGGASRGSALKSLALYAHKRFGEKRFDYEFFPDEWPGETRYKSFLLRNAGNDFDYLYMRDAIIQRTMARHCDVDWQAWRPAIVFINGTYRGIENFRERSNDHNIYTHYDGLEDVEVVENWNSIKSGDGSLIAAFKAFYNEHGHTWEEYEEWMDVSEFLDVMIMELFFNNLDAPGNNFCMWRPQEEGGRWRFILKDVDYTMGLYGDPYSYKILNWINNSSYDGGHNWGANSSDGTRLFRRLMEDQTFMNAFYDRCCIYMGDWLNHDGVWEVWEPMYNLIRTEYPTHRALFNPWWPNYNDEMNNARTWLRNRTSFFYQHLTDYYKLGTLTFVGINRDLTETELAGIEVEMNGIRLSRSSFNGRFNSGREIRLSGQHVSAWEVETVAPGNVVTHQTYNGSTCSFTVPNCTRLSINAVPGEVDGIESIASDSHPQQLDSYDLTGVRRSHLQRGINILADPDSHARGRKVILY